MTRPAPGDPAPPFQLAADDGGRVALDDLRGERVVLYFYPADDTPGCTAQACALRDQFEPLRAARVTVLGISPDGVTSHARFRAKHRLPFRLLADEGHAVAEAYGVWVEKERMGRRYMGVERTTFIIGPDGRIGRVLARVNPTAHAALLLEALAA